MTKHLNPLPENIHVIQEENSTVIQYAAICDGKRRFCQYFFRGLYEFESIRGQELTLKEMV